MTSPDDRKREAEIRQLRADNCVVFTHHEIDALLRRCEALTTALREALGAIWELRDWKSRDQYEADPAIKSMRAALAASGAETTDKVSDAKR